MKSRASSNWVVNSSVMMPSLKPLVSMVESAASRETAAAASDSFRQFRLVRLVCIIPPLLSDLCKLYVSANGRASPVGAGTKGSDKHKCTEPNRGARTQIGRAHV